METASTRNTIVTVGCCVLLCVVVLISGGPVFAERASLVIDADSGAVLHAKNARLPSFPASLTKLMTVYLLLEAVEAEQLKLADKLDVSAAAERQPRVKLGLRQGQTITLQQVLLALIVWSANDAAVVAAERIAGSEPAFATMMTAKANALGMSETVFRNASGLPHPGQITTARDMAILAQALMVNYPQYYHLFTTRSFRYRGKTLSIRKNFINSVEGAHGLKTGFTCFAGYNLVASAESDGRRLIGVILGEQNAAQRNARMAKLLKQAFNRKNIDEKVLTLDDLMNAPDPVVEREPNRQPIADVCIVKAPASAIDRASGWGLVVGVRKKKQQALALSSKTVRQYPKTLKGGRPLAIPFLRGVLLNRACITDLEEKSAIAACQQMRRRNEYCIVINPKIVRRYVDRARMALERAQAFRD